MRRLRFALLAAGLLTLAVPSLTAASRPAAPGFLPGTAHPHGYSLQQLATAWTVWGFETFEDNPNLDVRCEQSSLDPHIWFLPVSFLGEPDATCDVPKGSFLVLFAAGNECSNVEPDPYFGEDEAALRECVDARHGDVDLVEVSSGSRTTTSLDAYVVTTDAVTLPPGNLLSVSSGVPDDEALSMTKGWFLVIRPLPRGEHTFATHAEFSTGFVAGITYTINVR